MSTKLTKEIIPLYSRVSSIIQNKIVSGQYGPGDKLPTEDELVEYYGVSKITIRGALSLLENDGLIHRIRGKGTFVADDIPSTKQYIFTSLNKIDQAFKRSTIKVIDLSAVKVKSSRFPNDIRKFFDITNDDDIFRIQRIVSMWKVDYFYDNYIPIAFSDHITKSALVKKKSLQKLLNEKMGLKVTKGEMFLQAVPSEPDISMALQCQSFEPLIHMQNYFWHQDQKPFEIGNIFFRSSYFKYKVELDIDI